MKAVTLSNRIKNHSDPETWNYLKEKSFLNKTLRNLCYEKAFYLDLLGGPQVNGKRIGPEK